MKKIFIILSVVCITLVSFIACNIGKTRLKAEQIAAEKALRDSIAAVRQREPNEGARIYDSIKTAEHIKDVKNSIRLTSYYLSGANSCGGRDIHFNYQNLSKKTIKYLDFSVTFYNAVGDLAYDEIRGYCGFNGRTTGPIKPNGSNYDSCLYECAIYNYQAKKMTLNSIRIEYMDGSVLRIDGADLKLVKGYKG